MPTEGVPYHRQKLSGGYGFLEAFLNTCGPNIPPVPHTVESTAKNDWDAWSQAVYLFGQADARQFRHDVVRDDHVKRAWIVLESLQCSWTGRVACNAVTRILQDHLQDRHDRRFIVNDENMLAVASWAEVCHHPILLLGTALQTRRQENLEGSCLLSLGVNEDSPTDAGDFPIGGRGSDPRNLPVFFMARCLP